MMAGMDDKEDPENSITLEAMSGLSRILSQLDETNVRQILINICLRIRPCFEKVSLLHVNCFFHAQDPYVNVFILTNMCSA